jgi:hypothetical protein
VQARNAAAVKWHPVRPATRLDASGTRAFEILNVMFADGHLERAQKTGADVKGSEQFVGR